MRRGPHIAPLPINANRNVALKNDAGLTRSSMRRQQLRVQNILHIIKERHVAILLCSRCAQRRSVGLAPLRVSLPLRTVGRAVFVAQVSIISIRHEPFLCSMKKRTESLAHQHSSPFLTIDGAEIGQLSLIHAFVVQFRQRVKLFLQCSKVFLLLGILQRR